MRSILTVIILSVFFLSCERTVEIDMPQQSSKLAVNAQWPQNRLFTVYVSKSLSVTDPVPYNYYENRFLVKNAVVIVKENSRVADTLKWDSTNTRYISSSKRVKLDSSYTVEVSAAGFPPVSAFSKMPSFIRPSKVVVKENARTGSDGQPQSEVSVTFTDLPSTDYYLFRFRNVNGGFSCVNTNDNVVEKTGLSNPFDADNCFSGNKLLVTDKTFNGKQKTIVFYVNGNDMMPATDPLTNRTQRPWLEMMHIHEDYYRYIKSINIYDDVSGNPLAEPVNVVSNIKGGYGFFSTYTTSVDTLR